MLCIDRDGALVVVELKQGRTPREVAAQALDYASWAKTLEAGDIERIAKEYLGGSLEDALQERFGEVPDNWVGSSPDERQSAIGLEGAFHSIEEVDTFVAKLTEAAARLETT